MTSKADVFALAAPVPQREQEEHDFQVAAYAFVKRCLPGRTVWSVDCGWPGNTPRDHAMRRRRAARGIKAGLPDLWILLPPFDGLDRCGALVTFELKAGKNGRLSDAQLDRRAELLRAGHYWFGPIVSLEQIEACLRSLGQPLAATTGKTVPVPQIGARRLANYAKLHDPLPLMVAEEDE